MPFEGDSGQGSDLVGDKIFDLAGGGLHLAAAEAGEIGESRMSSDGGAVLARKRDRSSHDSGVAGVKSAGHVCRREYGNQRRIVSDFVGAKRLAHVAIQVNLHAANVSRTAV